MKRTTKTVYASDGNKSLVTINQGKAYVEYQVNTLAPDELDELAFACQAAAEELRSIAAAEELRSIAAADANDGTPQVATR